MMLLKRLREARGGNSRQDPAGPGGGERATIVPSVVSSRRKPKDRVLIAQNFLCKDLDVSN